MTDLIERAKDFCRTRIFIRPYEDAQDCEDPLALIAELADALEAADKRIEQLEAELNAWKPDFAYEGKACPGCGRKYEALAGDAAGEAEGREEKQ